MNAKQERFCLEYASCGNATQSAIKAGYSEKTARSIGQRLLTEVDIKKKLQELAEEMQEEKIANAKEMQERLTEIIRSQALEEILVTVGVGEGLTEAQLIEKRPQIKDIIKAIDTLAKMQGCYDSKSTSTLVIPVFSGADELED